MNKNEMQDLISELKDRLFQLENENSRLKSLGAPSEIPPLKDRAVGVTLLGGEYCYVVVEYDAQKKLSKVVDVQPTGKNTKSFDIAHAAGKQKFFELVLQNLEFQRP